MNKDLLLPEIQKFIKDHEHHDPFVLSLKYKNISGVSIIDIAGQIQSRQKAKKKLPEWYQKQDIFYPPVVSVEQSSSQIAAQYKSSLIKGKQFIDLTGGMGVDIYYFAKSFDECIYVEKNAELAEIAKHNFSILSAKNIKVVQGDAETIISHLPSADFIYLDPSRRTNRKVFLMSDSEPDMARLLPKIFTKTSNVLLKLSPMMDIAAAVDELKYVATIHIVSINNDLKETLYFLKRGFSGEPIRHAINITGTDREVLRFSKSEELGAKVAYALPQSYLFEPNAAVLKSGAFKILSQRFNLSKLHVNSHLYTSHQHLTGFPGRIYMVREILKYDLKSLKKAIPDKKINLVVRNFPLSVDKIKKETGFNDGGDNFLFFTTDMLNKKVVLLASRV